MPTRSCKSLDAAGAAEGVVSVLVRVVSVLGRVVSARRVGAAEGAACASCRCWGARER